MKKKIALITGGSSGELEISLKSAKMIMKNLDNANYEVYLLTITGNDWIYVNEDGVNHLIDKNDFTLRLNGQRIGFDCVFIAIHGTPGEDGKLQGYFDLMRLPYTSCDMFTSSLTFNKYFANLAVESLGVPVARTVFLRLRETVEVNRITDTTGLPCFVKPNKGGSSVGVTKVKNPEDLVVAINHAMAHDHEVLVQEYLKGREITCGLMRYMGNLIVFPLAEIVSKKEFFDYEAKYTEGMADEIIPAPIAENLAQRCTELSAFLYDKLNCKGIVRFDYVMDENTFYFLEVNTIPGLSESSIVPRQASAMGISLQELFTMAIEDAIEWTKQRERFNPHVGN